MTRSRSIVLTLLVALALFSAGVVSGAGGVIMILRHRAQLAFLDPTAAVATVHEGFAERFDLTPSQRKTARAVFDKRLGALLAARREHFEQRVEPELALMAEEIRALLDDDQEARFDARWGELRRRWWQRDTRR